jgi:SpoVK/Ycf46/Vps4 family AAA+-type ATPase
MNVERDIRYELLARLCPNTTGAELRSVCTEAGMFAIRARRKLATEKDFLEAVNKVVKGYQKFSSTPKVIPDKQIGSSSTLSSPLLMTVSIIIITVPHLELERVHSLGVMAIRIKDITVENCSYKKF